MFQRYAATTKRSDEANAEALAAEHAPTRIVRHYSVGFEGRNDLWESPRYMLNLACLYRQVSASSLWQLLEREGTRCGRMRVGPTISFRSGEVIRVPRASERAIVVAWLDVHAPLWQRLRTALFRPNWSILVTAGSVDYRIATTQVAGPLLVRVPEAVGWDRQFGGGVEYDSLRVNSDGKARFAAIPIAG